MTAEDIRRNEEVGFITSRRRFCVAEDGAFIQSVGIKKPVPGDFLRHSAKAGIL